MPDRGRFRGAIDTRPAGPARNVGDTRRVIATQAVVDGRHRGEPVRGEEVVEQRLGEARLALVEVGTVIGIGNPVADSERLEDGVDRQRTRDDELSHRGHVVQAAALEQNLVVAGGDGVAPFAVRGPGVLGLEDAGWPAAPATRARTARSHRPRSPTRRTSPGPRPRALGTSRADRRGRRKEDSWPPVRCRKSRSTRSSRRASAEPAAVMGLLALSTRSFSEHPRCDHERQKNASPGSTSRRAVAAITGSASALAAHAFCILISNFDDHRRNHAFLRTSSAGWSLSPPFDLNRDPRPGRRQLSTAIDFDDNEARIDKLVVAPTGGWRDTASRAGFDASAVTQMARPSSTTRSFAPGISSGR